MDSFTYSWYLRGLVFAAEILLATSLVHWIRSSLRGYPEPWSFFLKIISYGGAAALISAWIEIKYSFNLSSLQQTAPELVNRYGTWFSLLNNLSASAIEELAKYVVAIFTIYSARHIHKLSDAIVYMILIGIGFSLVEDLVYSLAPDVYTPYRILSFFLHSGTSAIIGFALGRSLSGLAHRFEMIWSMLGAIGLHAAYNLSVTLQDGQLSFILTVLIVIYITLQIFVLFRLAVLEEYRLGHRFAGQTTQRLLNL
ncbi:PrsW family intramembrane metalloprotease [Patescibacteria group bacterium]|nr:PrsW family intramembrane metalloprotease [Patescibacteria group bacterium]